MFFYVGLHHPSDAHRFERCMISVNRLSRRFGSFAAQRWILDSGAFTRLSRGRGHMAVGSYAHHVWRFSRCGTLEAAVCQDWMCESFILKKTGLSVGEHQARTIHAYRELRLRLSDVGCNVYVMPVLQGYEPDEYRRHLRAYDLPLGSWTGVGSVCKRNSTDPGGVLRVLQAIKRERPDLRLHGFGLKKTYLRAAGVRHLLHSADSMAWSYAARRDGGDANSWHTARRFAREINEMTDA